MKRKQNTIFFVIAGLILLILIYFLAPILTPFLTGAILAYLVNPVVNRLMRWHLNRLVSVTIVFLLLFFILLLVVLLLIPLIQKQIDTFIILIPKSIDWFEATLVPQITSYLGNSELFNSTTIKSAIAKNWTKAGDVATVFFATILQSGFLIISWVLNLIIIPVVTFYLLRDWKTLINRIHGLIPRHIEPTTIKIMKECDQVLSSFFRGQLLVMLVIGIYYSIGLTVIGLDVGIILGLILGLISIVPYLGIIVGIVTASLAAYLQFGTFHPVLLVWLLFGVGQLLDSLFITPNLVGDRIGLHPVAVIFAVLAGGSLFGFFGVLLALPVSAVIMVWLRHLEHSYHESQLYR